jgi:urease accessory protein UreF
MTKATVPAPLEDRHQKLARSRQRQLGKALAKLYAAVTTEAVPDDFLELLEQTDARKKALDPK